MTPSPQAMTEAELDDLWRNRHDLRLHLIRPSTDTQYAQQTVYALLDLARAHLSAGGWRKEAAKLAKLCGSVDDAEDEWWEGWNAACEHVAGFIRNPPTLSGDAGETESLFLLRFAREAEAIAPSPTQGNAELVERLIKTGRKYYGPGGWRGLYESDAALMLEAATALAQLSARVRELEGKPKPIQGNAIEGLVSRLNRNLPRNIDRAEHEMFQRQAAAALTRLTGALEKLLEWFDDESPAEACVEAREALATKEA